MSQVVASPSNVTDSVLFVLVCSFCKGATLYSVVRERGHMLDINKTRQIAQEIVKVGLWNCHMMRRVATQ